MLSHVRDLEYEMKYKTVIRIYDEGVDGEELVGEISSFDKHHLSGAEMNWLFEPQPGQQFGQGDLRAIAEKLESLEPSD